MLTPELVGLSTRGKRVAAFAVGTSADHPSIQLADLVSGAGRVVFEARQGNPGKQGVALHDVVAPLLESTGPGTLHCGGCPARSGDQATPR